MLIIRSLYRCTGGTFALSLYRWNERDDLTRKAWREPHLKAARFWASLGFFKRQIVCAGQRTLTRGVMVCTRCVVRHPRGSYVCTHCCLWRWPHQRTNQLIRRCHPYARKPVSQAVLSRMYIAHPPCYSSNTSRSFALGASNV